MGKILDKRLNFGDHIDRLVKKARQRIGGIGRVPKYITRQIALTLYKAMVVPLFDFGAIIYMFASQDNSSRLEIIQYNTCQIILHCNKYIHVSDMQSELGLTTLFNRRDFHICVYSEYLSHVRRIEVIYVVIWIVPCPT